MKRPRKRWSSALPIVLLAIASAVSCSSGDGDGPQSLQGAIDSLRNVRLEGLSEKDRQRAYQKLDKAWETLMSDPPASRELIAEALDEEPDDDFFVIDLAVLYALTDPTPEGMRRAVGWLSRANPNAYPSRYFEIASGMAASRCEECLPVILKLLELEKLQAQVRQHNLPVDLNLGLLFTVGSLGESAMPEVVRSLESDNCVVRANAARVVAQVLPAQVPDTLRRMAAGDPCDRARHNAWIGLAPLDPVALVEIIEARLDASPPPDQKELLAVVEALRTGASPPVLPALRRLAENADKSVASAADQAMKDYNKARWGQQLQDIASSTGDSRDAAVAALEQARESGEFRFDGSLRDLVTALTVEDFPLVNEARLSVLRRLSGECLEEFHTLSSVAQVQRKAQAGASTVR